MLTPHSLMIATCACGQASITVSAPPTMHGVCHCTNCKRRTGSAFGISAYFDRAAVIEQTGKTSVYAFHLAAQSHNQERHFCPKCGTTLFGSCRQFPRRSVSPVAALRMVGFQNLRIRSLIRSVNLGCPCHRNGRFTLSERTPFYVPMTRSRKSSGAPNMTDPILIELPAFVETERLLLRPPRAGDGPALFAAVSESLSELRRFLASLPWVATEQIIASSEIYCRTVQANFLARKDLPFLLFEKASGQLVGATGIHRAVWETPKAEIGYCVRTSRTKNGFVGEAVTALTEFAFEHLHAARVELITDEENLESRKVAERCKFTLEGGTI